MEPERLRAAVGASVIAGLVVGAFLVLQPFLVPVIWAAILVYTTWPVYRRIRAWLRESKAGAALLMTLLLILAVAGPAILLSLALADEAAGVFRFAKTWAAQPPELPSWLRDLPWIGEWLAARRAELVADPHWWQGWVTQNTGWLTDLILGFVGGVGRNLVKVSLSLLTVAFLYFHWETVTSQTRTVVHHLAGPRVISLMRTAGGTVRAVWYGMLLTAAAQGLLAGLGFWALGLPAPILLGATTAFLALIPFGPPIIWLPAGIWMLAQVSLWKGLGLLVWGALVVSGIDNVLRPFFIGSATRIPYLLVLFGVLGGLGAFGLLGLFLGPTILSVLLVVWRGWAEQTGEPQTSGPPARESAPGS